MALPAHLQKIVNKVEAEEEKFKQLGGDPEWYKKALEKANKNNDDNNIIHAVITNNA